MMKENSLAFLRASRGNDWNDMSSGGRKKIYGKGSSLHGRWLLTSLLAVTLFGGGKRAEEMEQR